MPKICCIKLGKFESKNNFDGNIFIFITYILDWAVFKDKVWIQYNSIVLLYNWIHCNEIGLP